MFVTIWYTIRIDHYDCFKRHIGCPDADEIEVGKQFQWPHCNRPQTMVLQFHLEQAIGEKNLVAGRRNRVITLLLAA